MAKNNDKNAVEPLESKNSAPEQNDLVDEEAQRRIDEANANAEQAEKDAEQRVLDAQQRVADAEAKAANAEKKSAERQQAASETTQLTANAEIPTASEPQLQFSDKHGRELCWNCMSAHKKKNLLEDGVCPECGFDKNKLFNGNLEAEKAGLRQAQ